MPLRDHFHPPLSTFRHGEAFHGRWAHAIADSLNRSLPAAHYYAEAQVHAGSRVEIDVATFEADGADDVPESGGSPGTATMQAKAWAPPIATMVMPAIFPDSIEVVVYSSEAGPTLVAAIELVSPGNKDREETRSAFAAKCATYLRQGVGLIVVDVVTERHANLHNELVRLLGVGEKFLIALDPLYVTAYRPVRKPQNEHIQVWASALAVGGALPVMPLALDKSQIIPVDFNAAYVEACRNSRLP